MGDLLVSRDLERCVLGAAIEDPSAVVGRFDELQPTDFYDAGHQKLWRLLLAMSDAGQAIDLVSVCERVRGDESAYGGLAYVAGLPNEVTSSDVSFHVARLRDMALRRDIRARLRNAVDNVAHAPVDELVASIDPGQDEKGGGSRPSSDIAVAAWQLVLYKREAERQGQSPCLPTPWPKVTRRWRSFFVAQNGGLTIIAGRPGMGKTSLGLQICQHITASLVPDGKGGHRRGAAHIFSMEMPAEDCELIQAAQRSGVSPEAVAEPSCSADKEARFRDALEELSTENLWIDDQPGRSAEGIIRRIKRHIQRHGPVDVVMIDYAELLDVGDSKSLRYGQLLGAATKALRNASREMGFQVLLIWQLNRQVERRTPPIPVMSDLSESGEAERHADLVVLLYRDEYYNKDTTTRPGKVDVITAKFRKGQVGVDELDWDGPCRAFRELDTRRYDAMGAR